MKNLYAYCDNNPVSRADVNGDSWVFILLGAATNIYISAFTASISGEKYTIVDALVSGVVGGLGFTKISSPGLMACVEGVSSFAVSIIKHEPADDAIINGFTSAAVSYLSVNTIIDKAFGNESADELVKDMTNYIFGIGTSFNSFCISTTLKTINSEKEKSLPRKNLYQRGRSITKSYGKRFNR